MNILILGGSFGISLPLPETHIEFLLRDLGHNVYNASLNGASNLLTLKRAQHLLAGGRIANSTGSFQLADPIKFDLVIWFHGNFIRDFVSERIQGTYIGNLDYITTTVYKKYAEFINYLKCPLFVIGDASRVSSEINNFLSVDYLITDWVSDLLGLELPQCHLFGAFPLVNQLQDDITVKLEMIKSFEIVVDAMEQSNLFPDQAHPGAIAHQMLFTRLGF